jgi:hypothetical protein
MPPVAPPNAEILGRIAANLLFDDSAWVHRRKETVRILDDAWFRRQISIDYELPESITSHRQNSSKEPVYAVPVTLMRKSPPAYVNFDMRDQGNTAMALMTREQNAVVSLEALRWAARQAAASAKALTSGEPLPPAIDMLLQRVARRDSLSAGFAVRALHSQPRDAVHQALFDDDRLMWLALAFAEHSVVMVEVLAGDGRRRLIKLSYDERNINRGEQVADREYVREARGGLRPYPVFIDSPFIVAGTYHFELEAPSGLEVVDTRMREYGFLDALKPPRDRAPFKRAAQDQQHEETAASVRRGTRTHLYAPDAGLTDRAEVDVLLRVQREGFVSAACWVATVIAALLLAFLVALQAVIEHQGVIPSVLLLVPGIVATLVGRAGDHQLTIRMLNLARRALLLSAACGFAATIGLALSRTGNGHDPTTALWILWAVVTAVAIYCAMLLQLARRLPKRNPTARELWAGRMMRPLISLLDARFLQSS